MRRSLAKSEKPGISIGFPIFCRGDSTLKYNRHFLVFSRLANLHFAPEAPPGIAVQVKAPRTPRVALSISSNISTSREGLTENTDDLAAILFDDGKKLCLRIVEHFHRRLDIHLRQQHHIGVFGELDHTWISSAIVSKSPENNSGSSTSPQYAG
jgi:hypothetical protein